MAKTVERRTHTYHGGTEREIAIEFTPGNHRYKLNGEYAPSVTTMLNLLAIDALPWYGMKVGVKGVAELVRRRGDIDLDDTAGVIRSLCIEKLTVNHDRQRAADRGNVPHTAMHVYAENGTPPSFEGIDPELHGYMSALAKFMLDARPEFVDSELLVASRVLNYTGTLDGRVIFDGPRDLVADWWIDDEGQLVEVRDRFDTGLYMIDAKTGEAEHNKRGKGIYLQHHLQLAAYEFAAIECGKSPTDAQLIVHLHESGRYKVVRGVGKIEWFSPLIPVYHVIKEVEKAMKDAAKAVVA